MKVIYTGYFVNDRNKLLHDVPIVLLGSDVVEHAHHITKEFKPVSGLKGINPGTKHSFTGFAEVITDRIQAILVRSTDGSKISTNPYPHITLATAKGAAPAESNVAIEQAVRNNSVRPLVAEIEIQVIEGYFDGKITHVN